MPSYSYADCLERSYRVNWKIRDVLGFVDFDRDRPWLPAVLSGGPGATCLDPDEKRRLTQVEMGAYAHLFGFVETFIAPQMVGLAQEAELEDVAAFEALTNFASEEVKHIHLFQEIRKRVDESLGFALERLGGHVEVADAVLNRNRGAVLLLTSAIEWFTQFHFTSAMQASDELDPLTKEIFRFHWLEEAQHARLDHIEAVRVFGGMTEAERLEAAADFTWLLRAVDGLLRQQVEHDLANLGRHLRRAFTVPELRELKGSLLRAKRFCFLESGLNHPNFQELFKLVLPAEPRAKVQEALGLLLREELAS